jgi:hypothetical protein
MQQLFFLCGDLTSADGLRSAARCKSDDWGGENGDCRKGRRPGAGRPSLQGPRCAGGLPARRRKRHYRTEPVRDQARYGTDGAANGFRFDERTVTNVDVQAPDAQSNVCVSNVLFIDGFVTEDMSAWSLSVP